MGAALNRLCAFKAACVCTALIILFTLLPVAHATIVLEQDEIMLGESITYRIDAPADAQLTLTTPSETLRMLGDPTGEHTYHPPEIGEYRLALRSVGGSEIAHAAFTAREQTLFVPMHEEDRAEGVVTTDADRYILGERVLIITTLQGENVRLTIRSPTQAYTFLGSPDERIRFVPTEVGEHEIIVEQTSSGERYRTRFVVDEHTAHPTSPVPTPSSPALIVPVANESPARVPDHQALQPPRLRILGGPHQRSVEATLERPIAGEHAEPEGAASADPASYRVRISYDNETDILVRGLMRTGSVRITEPQPPRRDGARWVRSYAIDLHNTTAHDALIKRVAKGDLLYHCEAWDAQLERCIGEWERAGRLTPGEAYTLPIESEQAAFAEALEILNVQSYPVVGGWWEVRYRTLGEDALRIQAWNATTWSPRSTDGDLLFRQLRCDEQPVEHRWEEDVLIADGYACEGTGSETSRVLTEGVHDLRFEFAGVVRYAHNDARPWWNESWKYRRAITIENEHASKTLRTGYSINLTINTSALLTQGKLESDCSDLRITWYNGTADTLLEWVNESACPGERTEIWFALQENITGGSSTNNYSLYYGNPAASAPTRNRSQVYWLFEDFEDQQHPFTNGALSPSVTSRSAKNGNYGIEGNGVAGYRRAVRPESLPRGMIIEGWVYSHGDGSNADLPSLEYGMGASEKNGYQTVLDWRSGSSGTADMQVRLNYGSSSPLDTSIANTVGKYEWYYIRTLWDENGAINATIWNASGVLWGEMAVSDGTYSSGYYGIGAYKSGQWDDILVRLALSREPNATLGAEEASGIEVTLNSPADASASSQASVTFNCSATSCQDLSNITLYGDWPGSWGPIETTNVSGANATAIFTKTLPDGEHRWNCYAQDDACQDDYSPRNHTITIDTTAPTITIHEPPASTADATPPLNITLSESADRLWYRLDGGENVTVCTRCEGGDAFMHLAEGNHTIEVFANDTLSNQNATQRTITTDFNATYDDTFLDDSAIAQTNGVVAKTGNLSFHGTIAGWWDPSFEYRRRINITNTASASLEAGYTVNITLDTASLIDSGRLESDCSDLRIAWYNASDASSIELDRVLMSACNSSATTIRFATQEAIGTSSTADGYYVYYDNPSSGSPPENRSRIYLFYDDFSDGDASDWTDHLGTWSVVDGAYTQTADITNEYMRTSIGESGWDEYSIEARMRIDSGGSTGGFAGLLGRFTNTTDNYAIILDDRTDPDDSVWLRQWIGDDYTDSPQEWTDVSVDRDTWMDLRFDIFDNNGQDTLRAIFDSITHTYNYTAHESGSIGLIMHGTQGAYDNITVRHLADSEPAIALDEESDSARQGVGNATSYPFNTTDEIVRIENVSWTAINTDENNTLRIEVSLDGGTNWCNASDGEGISSSNCASFARGRSLLYRLRFTTTDTRSIALDRLTIEWLEDTTAPAVTIVSPAAQSVLAGLHEVRLNVSDDDIGVANVTYLLLNASGDEQGDRAALSLIAGDAGAGVWNATLNTSAYAEGPYNLTINASDDVGNANASERIEVTLDNTPPGIGRKGSNESGIIAPNTTICINTTSVSDANAIVAVTALIEQSNQSMRNVSLTDVAACAGGTGDGVWGASVPVGDAIGTFTYNATTAEDAAGNTRTNTSALTLQIGDAAAPSVDPLSPKMGSGDDDGNITFRFNASDETSIESCSLIINHETNQSRAIGPSTQNVSFNVSGLDVGAYRWRIDCTDEYANTGSSALRVVHVILASSFDGESTDLASVNTSSIENLTLDRIGVGKIRFAENVNLSGGADLDSIISITSGTVSIDSEAEPRLNRSATLDLYDLSYAYVPAILRDGEICTPPACRVLNYTQGNLTFNVSGFSSYTTSTNSKLGIWDTTDDEGSGNPRYIDESVTFYANYSNRTSGDAITGADCAIAFPDENASMGYDAASGLYTYNRTFSESKTITWNVTCNATGYELLNTSDDIVILSIGEWWNASWLQCREIEIDGAGETLTNYPQFLNITNDLAMQSDYDDLRFIDAPCESGGSELTYDLEWYDTSEAHVWVKIPTLSASGKTIALYYGNDDATSTEDKAETWNADYGIVYHMNRSGEDVSGNGRDRPADDGSPTADDGTVGYGLSTSTNNAWDMTDLTYWEAGWSARTHEIHFTTTANVNTRQTLFAEGGTVNGVMLYIYKDYLHARWWAGTGDSWYINTTISASSDHHAVMTYAYSGSYALYLDGALVDSGATTESMPAHSGDGGIGYTGSATKNYEDATGSGDYFLGSIHAFHALDTVPSAAWINQSARSTINPASTAQGGQEYNHIPSVTGASFNATTIEASETVRLDVNVTDTRGSETVANVTATFVYPNTSRINRTLTQLYIENATANSGDEEVGVGQAIASSSTIVGEAGIIYTNGWTTVSTIGAYTDPVVIAKPREGAEVDADHEVATAIVTNVTGSSFKVQLRIEGSTIAGNVSYLVVENGTHHLDNGLLLQAGTTTVSYYDADSDSASSYYSISFPESYASAPAVIASPNEESAEDWLSTRYDVGSVTTSGASISLELDSAAGTRSAPVAASPTNTLAWVAINRTSATDMEGGIAASVSQDPSSSNWYALGFSNTYTSPLFFAICEQDTGTDPTTVGIRNLATTGVDIRLTEERTDGEQTHATEDVLYAVFEEGEITAGAAVEATTDPTTYTNVDGTAVTSIDNISVSILISGYDTAGSDGAGNDDPDLELFLASENEGGWVSIGNLSISSTGTYTLTTNDSALLSAWLQPAYRDVRIVGRDFDYLSASAYDEINWTQVTLTMAYDYEAPTWSAQWNDTVALGTYTITDIYATDDDGQTNHTQPAGLNFTVYAYPLATFNLLGPPDGTITSVLLPTMNWSATGDTNFANYTLQFDKDALFGSVDHEYATYTYNTTSYAIDFALDANSIYYWRVLATNLYGNVTESNQSWTYTTDNLAPSITLNRPVNSSYSTTQMTIFNYTPTDTYELDTCVLFGDWGGSFAPNETESAPIKGEDNTLSTSLPEGIHLWNVRCNDTSGNAGFATGNYTIIADRSGPNVSLIDPADDTYENDTNNINFTANATDTLNETASCELIIDGEVDKTKSSITDGEAFIFTAFVQNGEHNWSINCTDEHGFESASPTRNLSVEVIDRDPPLIDLNEPLDAAFLPSGAVTFNYTPQDATGIENCTLTIDGVENQTNSSIDNLLPNYFSLPSLSEGAHNWSISCYDNSSEYNLGTGETRNVTIDTTHPVVVLESPGNDTFVNESPVSFTYTPSDPALDACVLYGNFTGAWGPDVDDEHPESGVLNTLERALADGTYRWGVWCNDSAGNANVSRRNWSVKVDTAAPTYSAMGASPSSPATYNASTTYSFTIVWDDLYTVDAVLIEQNFSGVWANVSVNASAGVYTYNITTLGAGSYAYRWYANDSASNQNVTAQQSYEVGPAEPAIELLLNQTQQNRSIREESLANITARTSDPAGGFVELLRDGVIVQNGTSPVTNITSYPLPGEYLFTARYRATQNYTQANISYTLTVNDTTAPTITPIFPGVDATVGTLTVVFQYNVSDEGPLANCSLYIDGGFDQSEQDPATNETQTFTKTFSEGNYTWRVDCTDAAGNTGQGAVRDLTVVDADLIHVQVEPINESIERGENATFTITTQDAFSNPLSTNTTTYLIYTNATPAEDPWWDSRFAYRKRLNITNDGASALTTAYTADITLNTTGPRMQDDGDDVRIVWYNTTNGTYTELDRIAVLPFNTTSTELWFGVQQQIVSGGHDDHYYVYYGNDSVSGPPTNGSAAAFFYDDFEDADIAGWEQYGTGTVQYAFVDGGGAILKTGSNDPNGGLRRFGSAIDDFEVVFRHMRPNEDGGAQGRYAISNASNSGYGFQITDVNPSGTFNIEERANGSSAGALNGTATSYFKLNAWYIIRHEKQGSIHTMTAYNATDGSSYDTLIGNDSTVSGGFERFVIHGGHEFYTDDIIIRHAASQIISSASTVEEELIGIAQAETSVLDGQATVSFNTSGLAYGNYTAITLASSSGFTNGAGSGDFNLTPDRTPPSIDLLDPPLYEELGVGAVNFTYNVSDINLETCILYFGPDGAFSPNETDNSPESGQNNTFTNITFGLGVYRWNVWCNDSEGNAGFAASNHTLNITGPDLITQAMWFGNESRIERRNVSVYANITNQGLSPTESAFIVQLFRGDPDAGGVQIASNRTIDELNVSETRTINATFPLAAGANNIFVLLDVQEAINETDESNNKENATLTVPLYQYYYGNVTAEVILDSSDNKSIITFANSTMTTGHLFIADADSEFSFSNLRALGRTVNDNPTATDFTEADQALNTAGFNDSLSRVWADGTNTPHTTRSFPLSTGTIANVPIVNSTYSSAFITGIFWDRDDDASLNLQYDGTDEEDLVFATILNESTPGEYGTYDYEIRVPALLREYKGATNRVTFYYELT